MELESRQTAPGFLIVSRKGKAWFAPEPLTANQESRISGIVSPILKHGGHGVVLDASSATDTENMTLTRTSKVGLRMVQGKHNRCHANSAALAKRMKGSVLMNGFARIARDPIWRSHSWVVAADGHVIETTAPRDFYFGREER
jgi:hypothetical protein